MARQSRLLQEDPLLMWAILDEAVVHRPVGGPGVMRAQIDWLIEMCSLPHLRLQVVPFSSGAPSGADNSFSIFSFPYPHLQDVAYAESLLSSTYLDRKSEVAAYRQAHEHLADHASDADLTTGILEKARAWLT